MCRTNSGLDILRRPQLSIDRDVHSELWPMATVVDSASALPIAVWTRSVMPVLYTAAVFIHVFHE